MAREKYRLDPLARARQASVERATRTLADATRAKQNAASLRKRIEEDAARAEAEAKRIRTEERAAAKVLRAEDLATHDRWEIRAQNEHADREHRLEIAKATESKKAAVESAARAEVEKRQAQMKVVERDRARFEELQTKRAEAASEGEANDAWRKRE